MLGAESFQKIAEFKQIDRPKRGAAASGTAEPIRWFNISQTDRDRAQRSIRRRENDPVFTPMRTAADQLDLMAGHRVKRMADAHLGPGRAHTARG
jgi:hypothetical protein